MHLQVYIDTTDKDVVKVPLSEEEQVLPIPRRPQWVGLRYLFKRACLMRCIGLILDINVRS